MPGTASPTTLRPLGEQTFHDIRRDVSLDDVTSDQRRMAGAGFVGNPVLLLHAIHILDVRCGHIEAVGAHVIDPLRATATSGRLVHGNLRSRSRPLSSRHGSGRDGYHHGEGGSESNPATPHVNCHQMIIPSLYHCARSCFRSTRSLRRLRNPSTTSRFGTSVRRHDVGGTANRLKHLALLRADSGGAGDAESRARGHVPPFAATSVTAGRWRLHGASLT